MDGGGVDYSHDFTPRQGCRLYLPEAAGCSGPAGAADPVGAVPGVRHQQQKLQVAASSFPLPWLQAAPPSLSAF